MAVLEEKFEQYCIASGLGEEGNQRKTSTLLYCLTEEADDALCLKFDSFCM